MFARNKYAFIVPISKTWDHYNKTSALIYFVIYDLFMTYKMLLNEKYIRFCSRNQVMIKVQFPDYLTSQLRFVVILYSSVAVK